MSWGLARACEHLDRDVELAAINHWEIAIETHEANHPWADHYHARVEELDPRDVFETERVDILVAGPECTHFSTARGGRPVSDQKRASPWHVLDWLQKLYVDDFLLENVPEFTTWGPIGADGRPMKSKKGETFDAFVNALHSLGYSVDWRVLNAADYGDATTRERLFVIGRRQHRPEWPEPSHSEDGQTPGTEPWRPASEVIDWSDPGESIWTRDRPLVRNTMRRIAEGLRRYGHDDLEPFADAISELGKDDVLELQEDAVDVEEAAEVVEHRGEPFLVKFYGTSTAKPIDEPVDTVTANGGKFALCIPYLLAQSSGPVPRSPDDPLFTVMTRGMIQKIEAEAFLLGQHGGAVPRCINRQPLPTIATDGYIRLFQPEPFVLPRNGYHRGLHSNRAYDPEEKPLHTVTAKNHDGHLVTPYLVPFYGERDGQDPRTHDLEEPLPTVPASKSPAGVCRPYLVAYNGQSGAHDVDEPLPTVTTRDRFALCLPDLYPWGLDIRFRMLQPRELAAAMGFPPDYEFRGTKTDTVEQIGNAVPVNLAEALCERLLAGDEPTLRSFAQEAEADD